MDQNLFRSLTLNDWRQFDELEIEFDPRLTVLTGANASGKSTILSLLAKHFDWNRTYSAAPAPFRSRRGGLWFVLGRRRSAREVAAGEWHPIGTLTYGDGQQTDLSVQQGSPDVRSQYDVRMPTQRVVAGVFLTEHRASSGAYAPVATIPAMFRTSEQLFEQYTNDLRTLWAGSWSGKTPQVTLKESLIAAAVFGEGSESVERNEEAWAIWTGFQQVLKRILPPSLGYVRLRVRTGELIVETRTGNFILDEASGGMSALVEMAWQIFLRSRNHDQFVVLIDEPENHLHPKLQRDILPSLLSAFPGVQFIVATHSPFVVTATPDSFVYVLDYNERRRVEGRRLDYVNKAASADDTLRRVLGLDSTMPAWAEERFKAILDHYLGAHMSSERLAALREELRRNGLEAEFPEALIAAAERGEQPDEQ